MAKKLFLFAIYFILITLASSLPEQAKYQYAVTGAGGGMSQQKTLFAHSRVNVVVVCDAFHNITVNVEAGLANYSCWRFISDWPADDSYRNNSKSILKPCGHIKLDPLEANVDGVYMLVLNIKLLDGSARPVDKSVNIQIEWKGPHGYLSASDWPYLPFYGFMCLIYIIYGVVWLAVSFLQWRDLLRIQFWIGGVILLGMLEKAMFYAEYQNINSTGVPEKTLELTAEWVSCAKRTLARMLVIIVSLGFGIVKPRLGPMLHRVVGTGILYFVLASVESYLRVVHDKSDPSNQIASIPLAVLDSAICWQIFSSLVQTTRTLRLRRNTAKLGLYRHFTNTLIFSVISSIIFMLYSMKYHRFATCIADWKGLWHDDAFWHVLFSVILLVIMILWRPTNNNQRYAFTPLLDNPEDEDEDDEEEDHFVADIYGVKMRGARSSSPKPQKTTLKAGTTTTVEDDLKWVEENIPAAIADAALPILDSDEEIINTRFEVSKMQ